MSINCSFYALFVEFGHQIECTHYLFHDTSTTNTHIVSLLPGSTSYCTPPHIKATLRALPVLKVPLFKTYVLEIMQIIVITFTLIKSDVLNFFLVNFPKGVLNKRLAIIFSSTYFFIQILIVYTFISSNMFSTFKNT